LLAWRERTAIQLGFASNKPQQPVAVRQFHTAGFPRHYVHHGPLYFECIILLHVRISGSASVMSTVCSKWADNEPSCVTTVQPSFNNFTSGPPALTMGSMAMVMPGLSHARHLLSTKLGTWGSSWTVRPTPWPTNSRTTLKPLPST